MRHSNEDASFLCSISTGVLEEFRAEVCILAIFIHMIALTNLWNADVSRILYQEQPSQVYRYGMGQHR